MIEGHAGIGAALGVRVRIAGRVVQRAGGRIIGVSPDGEQVEVPLGARLHRARCDGLLDLRNDPRSVAEDLIEGDIGLSRVGEREALGQPALVVELAVTGEAELGLIPGHPAGEQYRERFAVGRQVIHAGRRARLVVVLAHDPPVLDHDRRLVGGIVAGHADGIVLVGERHQVGAEPGQAGRIDAEAEDLRGIGGLPPSTRRFGRRVVVGELKRGHGPRSSRLRFRESRLGGQRAAGFTGYGEEQHRRRDRRQGPGSRALHKGVLHWDQVRAQPGTVLPRGEITPETGAVKGPDRPETAPRTGPGPG